jgi:Tfp pilus assembly protein PilP
MQNAATILMLLVTASGWAAELQRKDDKEDSLYSSFGKRDPFRVPNRGGLSGVHEATVDPLRKFRLEGYRLRAIVRIAGKPQAMFEDPDGKSHVVSEGDRIGMEGAHISRIVNSEVIVTERSANYLGKETLLEKVISLPVGEAEIKGGGTPGVVQQSFNNLPPANAAPAVASTPSIIPSLPASIPQVDSGPAPASLPK